MTFGCVLQCSRATSTSLLTPSRLQGLSKTFPGVCGLFTPIRCRSMRGIWERFGARSITEYMRLADMDKQRPLAAELDSKEQGTK